MSGPFNPKILLRSPREKLGGYVILPRLIDKVRLHEKKLLPDDYVPNLLKGFDPETGLFPFDGRFLAFVGIDPEELRKTILDSPDDQSVLLWVDQVATAHTAEEKERWSESLSGSFSEPTPERIAYRTHSFPGLGDLLGVQSLGCANSFDLIDYDEGRLSLEGLKGTGGRSLAEARPPFPPFSKETALRKVRLAEDAWNSGNPERVALAYTTDSQWRNRSEFLAGRDEIVRFLARKWNRELDYRLIKELWAFEESRIAVRFAYEWHDDSGNWFRSYGNENWEFAPNGLMSRRLASINDLPIREEDRKYHWPQGRRPDDYPGLSDLGM
uniref:DUF5069 domain-containing protein n=1 Tax=Leptospirillum ferrodiazotrophum TaxID=412449 RepID=C6HVZ0_9BACT|nr:MAG: conserved protein of unknown function [Leptospirillum ferrodiazotrophum]